MSEIEYDRCENDDRKGGSARVGTNPDTGEPLEININGVAAAVAVQSAINTLGMAMKAGHEKDFLEKVSLALLRAIAEDPHSMCPLLTVLTMCIMMVHGGVTPRCDEEGYVVIRDPEEDESCMFDPDEEDDDECDEGPMDQDGTGEGGGGDGEDREEGEGLTPI
jgi:hypothetical protein